MRRTTAVHQVIGPPCSGKSTYVAERMKPGDLVLDWDAIANALSGNTGHGHHPEIRGYVAEAGDAILRRLYQCRQGTEPRQAWIISMQRLQLKLGSQLHIMDTPKQVCLDRLHSNPDGRDVAEAVAKLGLNFRRGVACPGTARQGTVWQARPGLAGLGTSRRGRHGQE